VVVGALGAGLLALIGLVAALDWSGGAEAILLQATVPGAIALAVVGVGVLVAYRDAASDATPRILGWVGAMGLALGTVALTTVSVDWYLGDVANTMPLLAALAIGVLSGVTIGVYDHRARARTRELGRQRAEREAAERQRLALLNQLLRHHLLNRLNAVDGYADLAAGEVEEGSRAEEHLAALRAQCDRMTDSVERFQVVAGAMDTDGETRRIDLRERLADVVAEAREAHPGAEFRLDPPDECAVRADELLDTALYNLLSNAVEHADGDRPTVSVGAEAGGDSVEVVVADDGPGIADDRKEAVFDHAHRGADSEGEGIGLFLTRTIVRRYGGRITVEDNDPVGSRFRITLPRAGSEAAGVTPVEYVAGREVGDVLGERRSTDG
jgi:signal transduction histidine kinase